MHKPLQACSVLAVPLSPSEMLWVGLSLPSWARHCTAGEPLPAVFRWWRSHRACILGKQLEVNEKERKEINKQESIVNAFLLLNHAGGGRTEAATKVPCLGQRTERKAMKGWMSILLVSWEWQLGSGAFGGAGTHCLKPRQDLCVRARPGLCEAVRGLRDVSCRLSPLPSSMDVWLWWGRWKARAEEDPQWSSWRRWQDWRRKITVVSTVCATSLMGYPVSPGCINISLGDTALFTGWWLCLSIFITLSDASSSKMS